MCDTINSLCGTHCSEAPIKRTILPLTQNVKDYLLHGGTLVVSGRGASPTHSQADRDNEAEELQWSDDKNTVPLRHWNSRVHQYSPRSYQFPAGSVFPKLNWSASKEKHCIAMNSSLECKTLRDVKSSGFITCNFIQPLHWWFPRCLYGIWACSLKPVWINFWG